MQVAKTTIRAQLEREILPLQGYKPALHSTVLDAGLGPIRHSFPQAVFPLGAVHEFLCDDDEGAAATVGFVSGITATLTRNKGHVLWIGRDCLVHPPALKVFGLQPEKIIFIELAREKDALWAVEEALKCSSVAAVVGEVSSLDFTSSRRLQLAVEKSKVTAFLFRHRLRKLNTTASLTRWKVTSIGSEWMDDISSVGFARWQVELLRVRNGRTGKWQVEWTDKGLQFVPREAVLMDERRKKAS